MSKILLINGANLNRIGKRNPDLYGGKGLDYIVDKVQSYAQSLGIQLDHFQSNHEGEIVDKIQEAEGVYDGIIINPGPFTQYSHAIRVTLGTVDIPTVEVHLVNILKTGEPTVPGQSCTGVICGFGIHCYLLGVDAIRHQISGTA
ncbi:MAG: type II 3-dehydroquinate dehydratase [Lachnospiraceae bacterium]|nr:type II 3-dehydroquinate dehydratase [Lachnospiraceae bacterium]